MKDLDSWFRFGEFGFWFEFGLDSEKRPRSECSSPKDSRVVMFPFEDFRSEFRRFEKSRFA